MKRIAFIGLIALLSLFACAPTESKVPARTPAAAQSASPAPEVPAPQGSVAKNYVDAAEALAADDFAKAKISLTAFAGETTGELQARAHTAADARDIAAMREAFKPLSELASKMELPGEYRLAYCPMYKGGAPWVQKKGDLANPYFGKASTMATCGSFVN